MGAPDSLFTLNLNSRNRDGLRVNILKSVSSVPLTGHIVVIGSINGTSPLPGLILLQTFYKQVT
jgi:hypothetical protein